MFKIKLLVGVIPTLLWTILGEFVVDVEIVGTEPFLSQELWWEMVGTEPFLLSLGLWWALPAALPGGREGAASMKHTSQDSFSQACI